MQVKLVVFVAVIAVASATPLGLLTVPKMLVKGLLGGGKMSPTVPPPPPTTPAPTPATTPPTDASLLELEALIDLLIQLGAFEDATVPPPTPPPTTPVPTTPVPTTPSGSNLLGVNVGAKVGLGLLEDEPSTMQPTTTTTTPAPVG